MGVLLMFFEPVSKSGFLIQSNLCTGFGWIRNRPQTLVYKHEMHFWGLFWHVHVKKKFYSNQTLVRPKTTKKDLKLKDWSKGLLVQSVGVKPPNTIKIGISKENLKHLDKEGFERSNSKSWNVCRIIAFK